MFHYHQFKLEIKDYACKKYKKTMTGDLKPKGIKTTCYYGTERANAVRD